MKYKISYQCRDLIFTLIISYPCRSTFASLAFPSLRSSLGSLRSCLALTSHTAFLRPIITYRRIGRSPARRATSDGERRDVRWGGGKGQWAARAEPRKWREAARRSLHGPFRSLITSGREPGQERDTPLVHPLLTSLPRSWRISSSCLSLATVSQSHSSAVGKGPASSPHSLHCVSVPRYTPPADRDRDRPASSFLSWTAGPSPGAPPPSAPLTPFTRRRLAAGVMRGVRNGPSFFRPITALRRPCRRNRAKEVTAFHSFPPSLRSGVSLPFPLRPYATPFVHFGHSVSSLVMLSPPFGHGAGTGTEPKVEWTERKWGGGKWTEDRH